MPIHDHRQSFNAGVLSPLLNDRTQVEKYAAGGPVMQNWLPLPQGPMIKRAGALYISDALGSSNNARVVGWNFQDGTYAVGEFIGSVCRFWTSATTVDPAVSSYSSGFANADLPGLQFAQINNTIYMTHVNGAFIGLITNASGVFGVGLVDYGATGNYPPLLDENISDTTIAPSATSGSVTLTASAATFTADNVGGYFELAQARTTPFAQVLMGDGAATAGVTLTITGNPANNDTITITAPNARAFTFKTGGRTAVDEIAVETDPDDTIDNFIINVSTGGQGADPEPNVIVQKLGGVKAGAAFGNTANTNIANGETVTAGKLTYTFTTVTPITASLYPYYVAIGANLEATLTNFLKALNIDPDPGDDAYAKYGTSTGERTQVNPEVQGVAVVADGGGFFLTVRARKEGAGGNIIGLGEGTTASAWRETASGGATTTATLVGGSTVLKFLARQAGAGGNSYSVAESSSQITGGGSLTGGADETETADITVVGKVTIRTNGRWTGKLSLLQKRDGSGTYDTINTWESKNDYNTDFTIEFQRQTSLRLSFTGSGERQDLIWPRAIIEPTDPFHRSLYKITAFTSTTQVTATTVIAPLATTATKFWSEGAWSIRRGFPRAVCFHQNRLWFGGTKYEPFKVWASQLGDFQNHRVTPGSDESAMSFQIASTDLQSIQGLASSRGLVVLTTRGEWVGTTGDNQTVITAASPPEFRQISAFGSEYIQPVMVDDTVIFVEKFGRRLRRIFYDASQSGFATSDLTVMAENVTLGGISSLAVQKGPETVIWCKVENTDEEMACLTYQADQNVYAWSTVKGFLRYESVACVQGPTGHEVWQIGLFGNLSPPRIIQRVDINTLNRQVTTTPFAVHLDCAKVYQGSAVTSIALPTFMVGEQVTVKYNNGVVETKEGTNPLAVTLTGYAQIGFLIESVFTSMRLDYALRDGTSQGRAIRIDSATARVIKSQGGGVTVGAFTNPATVVAWPFETAVATCTGDVRTPLQSTHWNDGSFSIYHNSPFPFLCTGVVVAVSIGDNPSSPYLVGDE